MRKPARSRRRVATAPLELDLRGKVSPYLTAYTYRALKGLSVGSRLVVLTDCNPACSILADLARDFSGDATAEQLGPRLWRVTIRKGAAC